MNGGGLLALVAVMGIAVLPLVAVYRSPVHNALDETVGTDGAKRAGGNRVNIFQRAQQGLNLTPGERAALKLLEALSVAFLVAAAPIIADALSSHGSVVWGDALRTALAAGAVAVLMAVIKYLKAQGDSPILQPIEGVLQSVADRLSAANGLNEPVIEGEIGADTPDAADAAPAPVQ